MRADAIKTREILKELYNANELYTGINATLQEDKKLGGREVMLENEGTNFTLTSSNFRVVNLGPVSEAELDALKLTLGR